MKCVKLESKQLNKDIVAELERIRDNLRLKGDHIRAGKVEKFKQEYFGGLTSVKHEVCMHVACMQVEI